MTLLTHATVLLCHQFRPGSVVSRCLSEPGTSNSSHSIFDSEQLLLKDKGLPDEDVFMGS